MAGPAGGGPSRLVFRMWSAARVTVVTTVFVTVVLALVDEAGPVWPAAAAVAGGGLAVWHASWTLTVHRDGLVRRRGGVATEVLWGEVGRLDVRFARHGFCSLGVLPGRGVKRRRVMTPQVDARVLAGMLLEVDRAGLLPDGVWVRGAFSLGARGVADEHADEWTRAFWLRDPNEFGLRRHLRRRR